MYGCLTLMLPRTALHHWPLSIADMNRKKQRKYEARVLNVEHYCTIRLEMDNTTAVACVNPQGGTHSYRLCQLALEIWQWAADRRIHLLAVHVPGVEDVTADYLSRTIVDDSSERRRSPR